MNLWASLPRRPRATATLYWERMNDQMIDADAATETSVAWELLWGDAEVVAGESVPFRKDSIADGFLNVL